MNLLQKLIAAISRLGVVREAISLWERYSPLMTSAFIAKALITVLIAAGSSVGLPYFMMALFSINNGLPFFDVMEAMKDFVAPLAGLSFIATISISLFSLVPGIVKLRDPANLPVLSIEEFDDSDISKYNRNRWCWSFVPALAVNDAIVGCVAFQQEKLYDRILLWSAFAGLTLSISVFFVKDMRWNAPGVSRIISSNLREKLGSNHWSQLLLSNVVGAVWFWLYATAAFRFLQKASNDFNFPSFNEIYVVVGAGFIISVCTVIFYGAGTAWGNRLSASRVLASVSVTAFFLAFIWPNGNQLLNGYLRALSHGGGKWIVLTVNASVAEQWPELFKREIAHTENKSETARTKPVQLALLGKDKVFLLAPPSSAAGILPGLTPIMIDRAKVEGIAFLSTPPNPKEGLDTSS